METEKLYKVFHVDRYNINLYKKMPWEYNIVYISKGSNGGYKKIKVTKKRSIVIKKFKKKGLKKGTSYYFKVVAVGTFNKKTWKSHNEAHSSVTVE